MQVTLCNRCPSRSLQGARLPSWTQQQGMAPLVPRTCTGAHLGTARRWLRGRVRSSRMQSAEDFPSWAAAAASALRHQPALRPQARCQQAAREKCLRAGRKGGLGPRGQGQRSRRRAEEVSVGISSLLSQVCPPTLRFSFGFAGRAALPGCKMLRARSSCTSPCPLQGTDLGHAFTPPPPAPCQRLHLCACSCHSSSCCLQLITRGASRGAESGWVWLGPGMGTGPSQPTRAQLRSLTRPVGSRVKPKGAPFLPTPRVPALSTFHTQLLLGYPARAFPNAFPVFCSVLRR